jgi:DHA1 family multidrug resistance protein-like MFS transporter
MNRNLKIIAISLFTWGIGEGMFIYFQPIYLKQLGASPLLIGTVFGGMGIAMAVTQIPAGYLGDKFGRLPLMWVSWGLGTVSAGIMAFSNNLNGFIFGLLLYGGTSFVMAPMNSYITHARGNWSIGRALTTASAAFSLGAVIGPMMGGAIADDLGLKMVYIIATGILVISTLMVFFAQKQPIEKDLQQENRHRLTHNGRFLTLLGVLFFTMLSTYLPQPLTSNFMQDYRHLTLSQIGTLGSIGSLGNAFLAIVLGTINARVGFLAGQLAVLLASVIIWKGTGLPWYMLGYFFLGGFRVCKSLSMALARPLIHVSQMGIAYGFIETVSSLAIIVAPPIAGLIYQHQPELIYIVAIITTALIFLGSLIYIPKELQTTDEIMITPERE